MNAIINDLAAHAPDWLAFWAVMNAQLAVFGMLVLAVDTLLRGLSPRVRYGLWLVVLLKAFVPPVLSLPGAITPATFTGTVLPVITAPLAAVSQDGSAQWTLLLGMMILAVTIAVATAAVMRSLRLGRLLRQSEAVATDALPPGSWPEVRMCAAIDTPLAAGFFRPRIFITPDVLFGAQQVREAVLYHELAHIRRRDRYIVLLQMLAQAVYALNPVAWLMNVRLHRYREQLCDSWALERSGARPQEYGRLLLGYAERAMAPRLQLQSGTGFFETRRGFTQRVTSLFAPNVNARLTAGQCLLIGAALLVLLPLSWKYGDAAAPVNAAAAAVQDHVTTKPAIVPPGQVSPERAAPKRAAPERVAPERVAPEKAAPERAAPEQAAFEQEVPEQVKPASIRGGLQALSAGIVYPDDARREEIEGMVVVSVKVKADGSVASRTIIKRAHPLLDDAAMRAVESVEFEPSLVDGTPVDAEIAVPIRFKLH